MNAYMAITVEGVEELKSIAAKLYRLADDAYLLDQRCADPEDSDCEGECGACPHFLCETRDRLRALGVDV